MLRDRLITAVLLGFCLLGVLYLLPIAWGVLAFGVVILLGSWEWAALAGVVDARRRLAYTAGIALLLGLSWVWTQDLHHAVFVYWLACAWWGLAFVWLAVAPEFRHPGLVLLCGVIVLVPCFLAIAAVYSASAGAVRGPSAVLWLLVWVFSADIGAYFAGRGFGRLKLAPRVSPSKTWEGVLGGLVLSSIVAGAGAWWFGIQVLPTLAFGLALIIVSIVGDLTESMFKRGAGLKDSGSLLPGHGGVLDRIDSITAAAPLYVLGLYSCGALL